MLGRSLDALAVSGPFLDNRVKSTLVTILLLVFALAWRDSGRQLDVFVGGVQLKVGKPGKEVELDGGQGAWKKFGRNCSFWTFSGQQG